jgi:hypothetical protein
MQFERAEYDTLLEAIERWEKGDDMLDELTDKLMIVSLPLPMRSVFQEEVDLRRAKAKEISKARKERGVLLRAKLLQMRDDIQIERVGPVT